MKKKAKPVTSHRFERWGALTFDTCQHYPKCQATRKDGVVSGKHVRVRRTAP